MEKEEEEEEEEEEQNALLYWPNQKYKKLKK